MKKPQLLAVSGYILFIIPAGLFIYSNSAHDTARCITTFEGQNSLVCRMGGSSNASSVLLGVSLIGIGIMAAGAVNHVRKKARSTIGTNTAKTRD